MTSSEYWKKRFEEIENMSNGQAESAANETAIAFDIALHKIEDEIRAWYSRLADNNEISYTDAIQLLSKNELAEFHWTVQEYIKYGEENAINQQWMKELENASAKVHITKLEELRVRVQQQIETVYGKVEQVTTNLLTDQYIDVSYHTAYEVQKGRNVLEQIPQIEDKQVQQVLKQTWGIDEKNFSSRIWDQKDKLVNTVKQDLEQAVIRGDSPDEIINSVSKFSKDTMNAKRNAGRLVMTESAVIGSKARQDTMKELDVEEYEIVATLDSKTSTICQQMDGKHFPMSEFKIGSTAPPFHVNCRTTTCPYFDDEFSDDSRAYRGEDGKTHLTDGDVTYEEWKKEYVRETQSKIVEQSVSKSKKTDITDTAISKVKRIQLDGYTDDELDILQEMHKELLRDAMVNNQSNEVVNMFSTVFDKKVGVYGDETSVRVSESADARAFMMGANDRSVLWMHNHPKGSSFSYEDIGSFLDSKIKTMTVVTNKGKVFALNKTNSFDIKGLYDKIKEIRNSYVSTSQYQDDIARDILKIITKYGVQYVK